MTITYKGNNISLGYDAATGTWGVQNTPTEYIDTEAFSSTDPDFVYTPPTTDTPEDEEDFNPCPAGYIYDSELKQCVIDPNAESNFMQTMQDNNTTEAEKQQRVQIAGTDRFTSDNNFIASDEEYASMSATELIENLKQRGFVDKNKVTGELQLDLDKGSFVSGFLDASLAKFGQESNIQLDKKKTIVGLLVSKGIIDSTTAYPQGGISATGDGSSIPSIIKIPTITLSQAQLQKTVPNVVVDGYGGSVYGINLPSDRPDQFGDITEGFDESVNTYANNFTKAYINNPMYQNYSTFAGDSGEATDKLTDLENIERRKKEAEAKAAEIKAEQEAEKLKQQQSDKKEEVKDEYKEEGTVTYNTQDTGGYVTTPNTSQNKPPSERPGYTGSSSSSGSSGVSYTGNEGTGTSQSGGGVANPHTDTGFSGGYTPPGSGKTTCFHPEQLIGNRFIKDLEPGDLINGIKILGMVKLKLDEDMYSLNDVRVTGTHKVKYNNTWMYVSNHPESFKINDKPEFVYVPIVEGGTFIINNNEFADYDDEHIETLNNKLKIA